MCQLLGLSTHKPVSMQFSLPGFWRRGGGTDEHADGWGIARFYAGELFVHREMAPAAVSSRAHQHDITHVKADTLIAHIRKATQGSLRLENNHPFIYTLWDEEWAFAHNGNLTDFFPDLQPACQPSGETDSERAFLWLVQNLLARFDHRPNMQTLHQALCELSGPIGKHGTFNFLLGNGTWLFAHCTTDLHYVQRQAPFGQVHLREQDININFAEHNHADDRFIIVATHPLTDGENWQQLEKNQLIGFSGGSRVYAGNSLVPEAVPEQALPEMLFAV